MLVPLDRLNAFGGLREINAAEQLGEKVCVRFAVFLIERQGGDIILIIVVGTLCYSGCSNAANSCRNAAVLRGIGRVAERIGEYIELPNHIRASAVLGKGGGGLR